jgi:carbon-monoxide dehydrogenase medium subunit
MKPARFAYLAPHAVGEAVDALASFGDDCKLLAGGQSLGPLLNLRLATPSVLVDLERIGELASPPTCTDSVLTVPAMIRQSDTELSQLASAHVPLLTQALPFVAHHTIRNRGTIGGSMAHADPSAELPAVAVASDASIVVQGREGRRRIPAESFFQSYFTTSLQPEEVILAIDFPVRARGEGTYWGEFAPRRGDFAIVGTAATVQLSADGTVARCRIAYSGVSDRPWRDAGSESRLTGELPSPELFDTIADEIATHCSPISDSSGSADYRRSLVKHLTATALDVACRHAKEDHDTRNQG